MIVSKTISTESLSWTISANYSTDKGKYFNPWLEVPAEATNSVKEELWDNMDYVFGPVFTLVEKMVKKQSPVPVEERENKLFYYLVENFSEINDIYEILTYARSLGWDKL